MPAAIQAFPPYRDIDKSIFEIEAAHGGSRDPSTCGCPTRLVTVTATSFGIFAVSSVAILGMRGGTVLTIQN